MAEPFRLHNTLTRAVEEFQPLVPGEVGLYVCGMTVYDRAHIGHARAYVVFDAFVRSLRARGWAVRYVRNFTDVDDKIIARAHEQGVDPAALAQANIDAFHEDMAALGLAPPQAEPRVSRSIEAIQAMIADLVGAGHAYAAEGSVWFAVGTCEGYGKLSGRDPADQRSADEVEGKRAPADFALWKAARPGEPSWESPWGPGRPGWHIECSAMSLAELGPSFDIHGGGVDLIFPHHENEVAQSECANRAPFARYWMHNGMLTLGDGRKMGKSLGNVFELRAALAAYPAEAIRLYLLQSHYRSPIPWGDGALDEALAMLARLYGAKEAALAMQGDEDADRVVAELGADAQKALDLARAFPGRLSAALAEDFNTALALGHAFELARAVNRFANHKKARRRGAPVVAPALAAFAALHEALGLLGGDPAAFHEEVRTKRLAAMGQPRDQIEALLVARAEARAARDWARADAIREDLDARGILVMDQPEGVEWRIRLESNA